MLTEKLGPLLDKFIPPQYFAGVLNFLSQLFSQFNKKLLQQLHQEYFHLINFV